MYLTPKTTNSNELLLIESSITTMHLDSKTIVNVMETNTMPESDGKLELWVVETFKPDDETVDEEEYDQLSTTRGYQKTKSTVWNFQAIYKIKLV